MTRRRPSRCRSTPSPIEHWRSRLVGRKRQSSGARLREGSARAAASADRGWTYATCASHARRNAAQRAPSCAINARVIRAHCQCLAKPTACRCRRSPGLTRASGFVMASTKSRCSLVNARMASVRPCRKLEGGSRSDDQAACNVRAGTTAPPHRAARSGPAGGGGLVGDGEPAVQAVEGQLQRRLHKGIGRERHWMAHPPANAKRKRARRSAARVVAQSAPDYAQNCRSSRLPNPVNTSMRNLQCAMSRDTLAKAASMAARTAAETWNRNGATVTGGCVGFAGVPAATAGSGTVRSRATIKSARRPATTPSTGECCAPSPWPLAAKPPVSGRSTTVKALGQVTSAPRRSSLRGRWR